VGAYKNPCSPVLVCILWPPAERVLHAAQPAQINGRHTIKCDLCVQESAASSARLFGQATDKTAKPNYVCCHALLTRLAGWTRSAVNCIAMHCIASFSNCRKIGMSASAAVV
jgi:hypothetical protein